MKHHSDKLTGLAVAAGLAAALNAAGAAGADAWRGHNHVTNVVEYQLFLDREQEKLDRQQANLDRERAALDRRKARWRSELADATWRFRMLDADNDAVVTETEANSMPQVAREFASLDTNDDGKLTASEFSAITLSFVQ